MPIRYQPPSHSPTTLRTLLGATTAAARDGERASRVLSELLATTYSAERVLLLGSGTQALTLAISSSRKQGDPDRPIGLPAYSCYDLATAAVGAGAAVRFYDLDPLSLTPEPDSVSKVLSDGVSALVAGNLFGFPLDWAELRRLCQGHGVPLIEDAAQAMGSSFQGKPGGSFGDMTILSFGRGKGWAGCGGGALLLRGAAAEPIGHSGAGELSYGSPSIRPLASSLAQWLLGRPALFGLPASVPGLKIGETLYRHPSPVTLMGRFPAALAAKTQPLAVKEAGIRRVNAQKWADLLKGKDGDLLASPLRPIEEKSAGYLRFPALLSKEVDDPTGTGAWKRAGVNRVYPLALPDLPPLAGWKSDPPAPYPGAERLAQRLITLPTHSFLKDTDFSRAIRLLSRS